MKIKIISLLVFIFLSSCAPKAPATPNVTVTFKVTVTSMPTETPSPTFTPTFTPIPTLSPEQLADMTPAEKIAASPASAEGYSVSNVSTVMDNIVIYRDADGKAMQVFNLLTGETSGMEDAPIVELPMTNGEYYEMKSFDTVEEMLQEIIVNDGATYGIEYNAPNDSFQKRKWLITGLGDPFRKGITLKVVGADDVLVLWIFSLGEGTVVGYRSDDDKAKKVIYLPNKMASNVSADLRAGKYPIPAKP